MSRETPIKQSFSWWCFQGSGVEPGELLAGAARIGYAGVELIDESLWPMARDAGLAVVAVNGHGTIESGFNRRENSARIEAELRTNLGKAQEWKIPVLICFSGRRDGLSDEAGLEVCAGTLARVAPHAEAAGVTLALELLNSRVDHADYQGDRTAWGVALCERVGSPAVKLLYDVYHMQIMEGDLIRTIEKHHPHIAHYHTAGNPGRGPMSDDQEIQYPAIYRAILKTGYTGYVGHEFLPRLNPLIELETAHRQLIAALTADS
jgi:hydroxypyruvate isomerase